MEIYQLLKLPDYQISRVSMLMAKDAASMEVSHDISMI